MQPATTAVCVSMQYPNHWIRVQHMGPTNRHNTVHCVDRWKGAIEQRQSCWLMPIPFYLRCAAIWEGRMMWGRFVGACFAA